MKKNILVSIISFLAIGASAQQMNTSASGDYKHPQMARKAQEVEAERLAQDKTTYELVYERNLNYKDQTNNLIKVKGTAKKENNSAPTNTDMQWKNADYKHSNGLQ